MDSENGIEKNRDELLGELQIYQLELEMQNEQLSYSYEMLEHERSKFADFFDLAPVGYFVLDHRGMVEEGNQKGLDLLDIAPAPSELPTALTSVVPVVIAFFERNRRRTRLMRKRL